MDYGIERLESFNEEQGGSFVKSYGMVEVQEVKIRRENANANAEWSTQTQTSRDVRHRQAMMAITRTWTSRI